MALPITAAQSTSLAGLFGSIGSAYASKAEGYLQQAGYAMQARQNLELAGLRADKEIEYADLQFKRKQFQTQIEQINYKIQANSLLDNLRRTNAAVRARAAANGVDIGSGTAMAVQSQNVMDIYRDVSFVNLSALTARVFGMEDATQILRAGYDSAFYEREAAIRGADVSAQAGSSAARRGGLLADAQLLEGGINFAQTFPSYPTKAPKSATPPVQGNFPNTMSNIG
jgi:hypothetical protein